MVGNLSTLQQTRALLNSRESNDQYEMEYLFRHSQKDLHKVAVSTCLIRLTSSRRKVLTVVFAFIRSIYHISQCVPSSADITDGRQRKTTSCSKQKELRHKAKKRRMIVTIYALLVAREAISFAVTFAPKHITSTASPRHLRKCQTETGLVHVSCFGRGWH